MPSFLVIPLIVLLVVAILAVGGLRGLMYTCAPNEVLIFSGKQRIENGRTFGYRLIKGGTGFRVPLLERVDRMDLTNIVIDIQAQNAYSKGGIPLTVQGVANVKIAGHEPLLNNAIERFMGRRREEVQLVAKATLEGALRGVLATMTPEQVNEDKILFSERLVSEVEQDMTALGLVVDTLKIQNVQDDVKYLDSIGRKRGAEVVSDARIAEAVAHADSLYRDAENLQRQSKAQIDAQIQVAKADAQKRLTDAQTRRAALVAEEQAQVIALVAQAKAEVEVQKARVEQIRRKLEADVILPAKAAAEAAEANAKAQTAAIVEDGKARADALRKLAETWRRAGPNAREVLLSQRLDGIMNAMNSVIPDTPIEKITMIDSRTSAGGFASKAYGTLEQLKQVFGVDLVEKFNSLTAGNGQPAKREEPAAVLAPMPTAEGTVLIHEPAVARPLTVDLPLPKKPKAD